MTEIIIRGWKCDRCEYQWASRGDKTPKRCAKCRSPYWNEPRKQRATAGEQDYLYHDGFYPSVLTAL